MAEADERRGKGGRGRKGMPDEPMPGGRDRVGGGAFEARPIPVEATTFALAAAFVSIYSFRALRVERAMCELLG